MQPPASEDALARRAEDLQALRQATQQDGDERDVTGELSLVGQHPADVADFTYQRTLQQTTRKILEQESAQIEAALRARQRGTYGMCQECGRGIPRERLTARPGATLCVECQRRQDTGKPT
jgi:RNA polymerase-binding transcription factor DksA